MPDVSRRNKQALPRTMASASRSRLRSLRDRRVERLLDLLSDQKLTSAASHALDWRAPIEFECAFVDEIWRDERVQDRIAELAAIGVEVEPITHRLEIAGSVFERRRVVVRHKGMARPAKG